MRTKTLLLSAVLSVAGAASVLAQTPVYSVNAVGYVNLAIPQNFSIIANPLDAAPNNQLQTIMPAPPDGTKVYKFENGAYTQIATFVADEGGWDVPTLNLPPGEGAFIKAGAAFTNTFVGTVVQGNTSTELRNGFSLKGSVVPQEISLDNAAVNFPVRDGDKIYRYVNGNYVISTYVADEGGWDVVPTIKVGEGFFVKTDQTRNWTRTFNVNG